MTCLLGPAEPGYTLPGTGVLIRVTSRAKPNVVSFGAYEFNLSSEELRREGLRLRLEGQPLAILQVLLDRPGELVTREELQKKLWPVRTVALSGRSPAVIGVLIRAYAHAGRRSQALRP
jgi:DNA-binding response OmpR family regulator